MTQSTQREPTRFTTSDGVTLQGDLTSCDSPKLAVLISAGTGFPRQFLSCD